MGEDSTSTPTIRELTEIIRSFVKERDWERFNRPLTLAISAVIEMGELMELFQWKTEDEINDALKTTEYKEALGEEISDVLVYLLRIADTAGIDISDALTRKMEKNQTKYPIDSWKGKAPSKL